MSSDLDKLAALASLIRQAKLARLASATAERRRIEAERTAVREMQTRILREAAVDKVGYRAGADALWLQWSHARQDALSQDALRAAAEAEEEQTSARRAFGRAEALHRLASRSGRGRRRDHNG